MHNALPQTSLDTLDNYYYYLFSLLLVRKLQNKNKQIAQTLYFREENLTM